jgi:hypothetical protein
VDEATYKSYRFADQLQGRHFVLDKREDNPIEQSTGDSQGLIAYRTAHEPA